jgi:hypothetical protein
MQKKIILALLLAAFAVGGAFAQQIGVSAGGGALLDFSGNNGIKATEGDKENYMGHRNTSFGAFAFFDVTYAEISAYFAYGSISMVSILDGKTAEADKDFKTRISAMQFGFSLLGKYPVNMGNFTIFPLIGVDYNRVLSVNTVVKDKDGKEIVNEEANDPGDMSQLGILAGIGGDIKLNGPLFVRLEGLLHIRLPAKVYKDDIEDGTKATLGFGPQIKIAIGYKF